MSEKDNEKAAPAVQIPVADLRDYFAAHAIPALIANSALNPRAFSCAESSKMCASSAYEIADALLKARAK